MAKRHLCWVVVRGILFGFGFIIALTSCSAPWHSEPLRLTQSSAIPTPVRYTASNGHLVMELQPKANLSGHEGSHEDSSIAIASLAWNPNGRQLAVGHLDGRLMIWDGVAGQPQWQGQLPPPDNPQADANLLNPVSLSWTPDGQTLASGNSQSVYLWRVKTGKLVRSLPSTEFNQQGYPIAVAWNPNGQTLATGGFGTVQLWNSDNGKLRQTLFTPFSRIETPNAPPETFFPQGNIDSLSWSPDGQTLAIAGEDRTIHLWDSESQRIIRQINANQGWIQQLSWSPNGRQWAVLGENIRRDYSRHSP